MHAPRLDVLDMPRRPARTSQAEPRPRASVREFYCGPTAGGVVKRIIEGRFAGARPRVSIRHFKDCAAVGQILIFPEHVDIVERAVTLARTGPIGRHNVGEYDAGWPISMCVWARAISPGEGLVCFGRVKDGQGHLGKPTTLARKEEIDALAAALAWLRQ